MNKEQTPDYAYFKGKLEILQRDLTAHTSAELARHLARLAKSANEQEADLIFQPAQLEKALEQDETQKYIDSLPEGHEDKMYEQITTWARQSYMKHKCSIRGQQITRADGMESHIIWATLRWAENHKAVESPPEMAGLHKQINEQSSNPLQLLTKSQFINKADYEAARAKQIDELQKKELQVGNELLFDDMANTLAAFIGRCAGAGIVPTNQMIYDAGVKSGIQRSFKSQPEIEHLQKQVADLTSENENFRTKLGVPDDGSVLEAVSALQKQVQVLQAENELFRTAINADPTFRDMKPDLDLIESALNLAASLGMSFCLPSPDYEKISRAFAALKRLKGDV